LQCGKSSHRYVAKEKLHVTLSGKNAPQLMLKNDKTQRLELSLLAGTENCGKETRG